MLQHMNNVSIAYSNLFRIAANSFRTKMFCPLESNTIINRLFLTLLLIIFPSHLQGAESQETDESFTVAFMESMFLHVNKNDAEAMIKAWSKNLAEEQGVKSGTQTRIIQSVSELIDEMQAGKIDAVGMTVLEYDQLLKYIPISPLFLNTIGNEFAEQFVLLAHKDSSINSLEDLLQKTIVINTTPRTCIIEEWLDLKLIEAGQPTAKKLTKQIIYKLKPSETILPVFFRQADVGLTSKRSFDLMSELNPQVAKQLKTIALSDPYVTTMLAFHKNYQSPDKETIINVLNHFESTNGGRQILLIFQSDGLLEKPLSSVEPTLELIHQHQEKIPSVHP